jgi:hypothetical protein
MAVPLVRSVEHTEFIVCSEVREEGWRQKSIAEALEGLMLTSRSRYEGGKADE